MMEAEPQDGSEISSDQALAALGQVLQSEAFRKAPSIANLLKFIVEHSLSHPQDKLKAYTVATQALGRNDDFDPQTDPIVRIQCGRLRKALALYYSGPGQNDPVRIDIPTGGYVPRLTRVAVPAPQPAAEREQRPTSWQLLLAIPAALIAGLVIWNAQSWFNPQQPPIPTTIASSPLPTISVDVRDSRRTKSWLDTGAYRAALESALNRFDETVVLTSENRTNRTLAKYGVTAIIVDGQSGLPSIILEARKNATREVVFTQTYAAPEKPAPYEDIEPVGRAARDLAQPFGAILTAERRDPAKTDDIDCVLRAIDYSRKPGKDELRHARVCLKWMITSRPNSHLAYALLSAVTLEPYRDGYKPRSPTVYSEAIAMARMAVKLAPSSARTHHALMKALFVSGFPDDALEAGKAAITFNPNDAEVATEYGCNLVYRNHVPDGKKMLDEVSDLISLPSVQYRFCQYLAAFLENDRDGQKRAAASLRGEPGMIALMAETLEASRVGDTTTAQRAIDALINFSPGFSAEPRATLLRRGWDEAVTDRVYQALLEAGLEQRITTSGVPNPGGTVSPFGP